MVPECDQHHNYEEDMEMEEKLVKCTAHCSRCLENDHDKSNKALIHVRIKLGENSAGAYNEPGDNGLR